MATDNNLDTDEELVELDEELDDELEVLDDDPDEVADAAEEDEDGEPAVAAAAAIAEEEDDDVPDADDVEASLDVILKERLVVEDEPESDEVVETDSGEVTERVLPKQADEFVCSSCFLVKSANQLADKKKNLCRDCV